MIDIEDKDIEIIKNILLKYLPYKEIRVFGSRVKGTARRYSDIDLAVVGSERIDRKLLFKIQDEFEFSELSIRVDIVDWCSISEEFKKIINEKYETLL